MSLFVKKHEPCRLSGTRFAPFLYALWLFAILGGRAFGQEPDPQHGGAVTQLGELLEEAEKHNPQIEAAIAAWYDATSLDEEKAIARRLGMREGTVKVHVRQILHKFGLTNRTQVAVVCANGAKADKETDNWTL